MREEEQKKRDKEELSREEEPAEAPKEKEEAKPEPTELELWEPKTELGRKVKRGEIKDIAQILESGTKIMEPRIVDRLIPNLSIEFLLIGQSKGKFGGGRRRIFKQTQKKTAGGNKPHFTAMAVVGNGDGYFGVGASRSKETLPAKEGAVRNAKLSIMQIGRGCGAWECACKEHHSIPFKLSGRCSSVRLELIPAPKGVGLCVENELKKVLKLAGIKDIWSKSSGQTRKKMNLVKACVQALKKTVKTRINKEQIKDIKFGQ